MISGQGTIQTAVEATKLGAFEFLEKPLHRDRVLRRSGTPSSGRSSAREPRPEAEGGEALRAHRESCSDEKTLERDLRSRPDERHGPDYRGERHGQGARRPGHPSPIASRAAKSTSSRSTARRSPRSSSRASCSDTRRAPSPGRDAKTGKFEQADGGTLFLDEIGDMTLKTQAKLLRVLEEGEVQKVGSTRRLRVDARVIAATNKDLGRRSAKGDFGRISTTGFNVVPLT